MKKYWSLCGIFSSFDFRKCNNIWLWATIKEKWQPDDLTSTKQNSLQSLWAGVLFSHILCLHKHALFVIFMAFTELLIWPPTHWTELFECSRPAETAGSRQPARKLRFYYFSPLLSNWKVSYLSLLFDLLTQPNKTLLCCTTTKSAVHFQPPNKWLAWFIWVISSMWRGPATAPQCKEPLFTTTRPH